MISRAPGRLFVIFSLSIVLTASNLTTSWSASTVKVGSKCTVKGKTVTTESGKFKCGLVKGKLKWSKIKTVPQPVIEEDNGNLSSPTVSPEFTVNFSESKLYVLVKLPSLTYAQENFAQGVKVFIKKKVGEDYFVIGNSSYDFKKLTQDQSTTLSFNFNLNGEYQGTNIYIDSVYTNDYGTGETSRREIVIPVSTPSPAATPTPTKTPSTLETVNQSNAKKSATSYLKFSAFSRIGLIKQLEYEGFSKSDAEYAVDAQAVDWNQQAAKSAASYLKFSSFSYLGLVKQLEYEGFTTTQSEYGAKSTGLTGVDVATLQPSPPISSAVGSTSSGAMGGCQIRYITGLPYSSQRIALTSISWERDSSGYLSAILDLRNDNSMALRLVEFAFSFLNNGSLVTTTSTLEGDHHFFIQDDAKFNSLDGTKGPWQSGQTRKVKISTNQILECNAISMISSGFTVKQGIGAS